MNRASILCRLKHPSNIELGYKILFDESSNIELVYIKFFLIDESRNIELVYNVYT
jgi:hypothetical protein